MKSGSDKKPYVTPQLIRHGSVPEITQSTTSGSYGAGGTGWALAGWAPGRGRGRGGGHHGGRH